MYMKVLRWEALYTMINCEPPGTVVSTLVCSHFRHTTRYHQSVYLLCTVV